MGEDDADIGVEDAERAVDRDQRGDDGDGRQHLGGQDEVADLLVAGDRQPRQRIGEGHAEREADPDRGDGDDRLPRKASRKPREPSTAA